MRRWVIKAKWVIIRRFFLAFSRILSKFLFSRETCHSRAAALRKSAARRRLRTRARWSQWARASPLCQRDIHEASQLWLEKRLISGFHYFFERKRTFLNENIKKTRKWKMGVKFLEVIRPFCNVLPEVEKPQRRVSYFFFYLLIILFEKYFTKNTRSIKLTTLFSIIY